MKLNLETIILKNLIKNDDYTRKVLPFLKEEYFTSKEDKLVFVYIQDFLNKYNIPPTIDALEIEVMGAEFPNEISKKTAQELIDKLKEKSEDVNEQWLLDSTEKFCQEKALINALSTSIEIMDGKNKVLQKGAIPQLLSNALAISFDPNVGHDYLEQYDFRYDYYHRVQDRLPFDLEYFNKITKGGIPRKTLNVCIAATGVGKSLFLCHTASSLLAQGKNVLYITLELAEEEVAKRIDANLLNLSFDDLMALPKVDYEKRINKLKAKTNGKLVIKEYPTASASVTNFRALLNELFLKKQFKPDAIFIDYINICASSRIKMGSGVNTYTYVKFIAEELRGLGVEFNVPIYSATQVNRTGFSNSDLDMDATSDSFGLPMTVDFMFALISSEELDKLNQIMVKQLKSRYNDINENRRFVIGIDRSRMKLYDVEQSAQNISEQHTTPNPQPKPTISLQNRKSGLRRDFTGIKFNESGEMA